MWLTEWVRSCKYIFDDKYPNSYSKCWAKHSLKGNDSEKKIRKYAVNFKDCVNTWVLNKHFPFSTVRLPHCTHPKQQWTSLLEHGQVKTPVSFKMNHNKFFALHNRSVYFHDKIFKFLSWHLTPAFIQDRRWRSRSKRAPNKQQKVENNTELAWDH